MLYRRYVYFQDQTRTILNCRILLFLLSIESFIRQGFLLIVDLQSFSAADNPSHTPRMIRRLWARFPILHRGRAGNSMTPRARCSKPKHMTPCRRRFWRVLAVAGPPPLRISPSSQLSSVLSTATVSFHLVSHYSYSAISPYFMQLEAD